MKRGRPPFANLHRMPVAQAAREVSDRVYRRQTACRCWVLPDGGVIVREHTERRFKEPPGLYLVGTYTPRTRPADIARDLRCRLREIGREAGSA